MEKAWAKVITARRRGFFWIEKGFFNGFKKPKARKSRSPKAQKACAIRSFLAEKGSKKANYGHSVAAFALEAGASLAYLLVRRNVFPLAFFSPFQFKEQTLARLPGAAVLWPLPCFSD